MFQFLFATLLNMGCFRANSDDFFLLGLLHRAGFESDKERAFDDFF
jgi:hypothetical protein